MTHFFRRYLPLILISLLALFFVPDFASLATYLYRLGTVSGLMIIFLFILGVSRNWGIFPANIIEILEKANDEPTGAAIVFASIIYLLTTVINAVVG